MKQYLLFKEPYMKHYLILIATITTTTISAMNEKQQPNTSEFFRFSNDASSSNKCITIYNLLPKDHPNIHDTRIEISDLKRIEIYNSESYKSDKSTWTLYGNEKVRFSPDKHKKGNDWERLGINNAGDGALINIYVHAAVKNKLMQLYFGKYSKVQFGDSIYFKPNKYANDTIILEHKDLILTEIVIEEPTKLIGLPDNTRRVDIAKKDKMLLTQWNSQQ
jgi:hypothetical protein